ncbi:uncharacterized protein MKK02DRAFT_41481 [Dioszegia hungarica]|uniref:DUF6534 domain-containing protein n=1 Tax=Dioszegia hungarica TaxID=4972 RepID=A0AA38H171_9TREE|nr:uncharacterized protein MKK02DRAFT_41481 [Dioszegia hungarica]KAI9631851.1 hypothetical protein MKK02DRAFT_41481 [Dioszegia hungarica]
MSTIPPEQLAAMEAGAAQFFSRDKGASIMPLHSAGFIDSLLMGIVITEACRYCRFVRTDRKHIVAMVALGVVGTSIASVFILLWMQILFVWGFGTYLDFGATRWFARYMSVNAGTTLLAFYIDRASRLFQHWWPAALIGPFAIGTCAVSIAFIRVGYAPYEYITFEMLANPAYKALAYSICSLCIVTDLLITLTVVYGLFRFKTGCTPATDSILGRLIIQIFEAQLPALAISVISFIMWDRAFQFAFPFVISQTKIYVLGMLITLNLRSTPSESSGTGTAVGGIDAHALDPVTKTYHTESHLMKDLSEVERGAKGQPEVNAKDEGDRDSIHIHYGSTSHLSPRPEGW